jgi:hypothetical protein
VLVGLLGKLVRGQVIALSVSCGGRLMGMGGKVMKFGDAVVRALRHDGSPAPLDASFPPIAKYKSAMDGAPGH